jgi:hypothetical protein
MNDAPAFQYADGCFCFRTDEIEVHIDEMTFDEYPSSRSEVAERRTGEKQ